MRKAGASGRIGPLEYAAGGALALLTLLLPLKYGSLAVMPEATSFFPGYWTAYLFDVTWAAQSFGILTGALLLFVLAVFGWRAPSPERTPMGRSMLLLALGLPLAALPGLIRCETLDYGIWEVFHLTGIGAYLWAVYLVLARRPEWRVPYIGIAVVSSFLVIYSGFWQYFVGFGEMRKFMLQQYEAGIPLGNVMKAKLEDDRVYGPFASCNALAGYLVLLLPVVGYALWRAGDRFDPQKISRPLLAGVGVVLLAILLLLTRGRGALLAVILVAGGFVLTLPMKRAYRSGLLLLAVLGIVGGAVFAHYVGRGFGSMAERVDYLRSTAIMVTEKPLTGHGWGGFFYRHMQLKTTDTDEAAHDPHNIVASFASQAGLPAGLLVAFALIYPLVVLGRRIYRKEADGMAQAIFWGEVAFLLHTLMDVNLQIPGSMALSGGLLLAALTVRPKQEEAFADRSRFHVPLLVVAALLGIVAFAGSWYVVKAEIGYDALLRMIQPQSKEDLALRPTSRRVEQALQRAVELRPYSPFPWESAGDFYLAQRDVRSAERCFLEALKRTASRPSVYERFSRIEEMRGNRERAGAFLQEAARRFPGNPRYTDALAERYPELKLE